MNLEIPSFKLSKQLKKAGYKQGKSKFVWYKAKANETDYFEVGIVLCEKIYGLSEAFEGYDIDEEFCICIDAPTVAELGEALPFDIYTQKFNMTNTWEGTIWDKKHKTRLHYVEKTEANARAKIWLYLKKEGLI